MSAVSLPATQPLTVLVVEDQALIAMLIEATLRDCGYEVILVSTGEEALARARSIGQLLAVVADLHLFGDLNGQAVIRSLRRTQPELPVVVVTGFHPEAPEADLRGLGGPTIRLGKPFVIEDLVASLEGVLAGRNGRAAEPSAELPRQARKAWQLGRCAGLAAGASTSPAEDGERRSHPRA